MLFAQVWHYWLSVPLAAGSILLALATLVGYLNKVVRPKYPPRGRN